MAKRFEPDWYLAEWVLALRIRFPHAWLQKETGWSDGKVSNVLSGKKRYDRDIINILAKALQIEPYELLMHPDLANAIRSMRKEGPRLAAAAEEAEAAQQASIRRLNIHG